MESAGEVYRKHNPEASVDGKAPRSSEVWWWFFMRLSGIILLFLVLIHLYVMHLVGAGVDRVDFAFVARRWDNLGWKIFDWALLALALLHGINGVRVIVEDYVRRPAVQKGIKMALYASGAVLLVMGTAVLVTFRSPTG